MYDNLYKIVLQCLDKSKTMYYNDHTMISQLDHK